MAGRRIELDHGGRRLVAHLFGTEDPAERERSCPGVLFVHGYGSDQAGYAHRAEAATGATGGLALTFDLGGHGLSEGRRDALGVDEHLGDVVVAYDALASRPGVDPARIGVCGASYGAALAARLVAERPVSRLLLRAPALLPDDHGRPPASLARFTGPVTVVESSHDEVVGHATIRAYLDACGGRALHEVIDAGHALADASARAAFLRLIVEWCGGL